MLDEPLTLNGGEDITDVHLILTNEIADLTGTAVDAEGRAVPGCVVALIPDGVDPRFRSRLARLQRADQNGRFMWSDLLSGSYFTAAATEIDATTWLTPASLDSLERVSSRVTLGPQEKKAVTMTCVRPR